MSHPPSRHVTHALESLAPSWVGFLLLSVERTLTAEIRRGPILGLVRLGTLVWVELLEGKVVLRKSSIIFLSSSSCTGTHLRTIASTAANLG